MTLPTERDLCTQLGLSRTIVREALRILESEGLIVTRTGRNGGSAVVRPDATTIKRSVSIFIRDQRLHFTAVLEMRWAIEPASARFAAIHRDEDDIKAMEKTHLRLEQASKAGDIPGYIRANLVDSQVDSLIKINCLCGG